MKRGIALSAVVGAVLTLVVVMVTGWSVGRGLGSAKASSGEVAVASGSTAPTHIYLNVDTPAMLGGTEETGPAFVPSAFTLPANSDVTLTIVNFDGPTALAAGSEQYAKTTGIKGSLSIQDLDTVHPNAAAPSRTAVSFDPSTGVSHTFTIAKLGLNVPLAPLSTTTFTFHTGAAGTYDWRCMDPCGNGPAGWGAAMSADGFMQGKVTFA